MRNAFVKELEVQAGIHENLVLLSGDIGNRMFDPYKEKYPDRFYNCGIAEANMTSVAAGMAMSGLHPVTYTIVPFVTSRCYEQIKIDVCCHNLPVIIVGVGGGLAYAGLGPTHHSFEDIAIMRVLPGMHIMCPADAVEVRLCFKAAVALKKPVYIRLGKKNEPVIHSSAPDLEPGKGLEIKPGREVCFLSCGNITPAALEAAEKLDQKGISTRVVSMHTVKPLDHALLEDVFSSFDMVCSFEEHSIIGGFGSAVAEWLADHPGNHGRLLRFGIRDAFVARSGNQENARKMCGLTPDQIAASVLNLKKEALS